MERNSRHCIKIEYKQQSYIKMKKNCKNSQKEEKLPIYIKQKYFVTMQQNLRNVCEHKFYNSGKICNYKEKFVKLHKNRVEIAKL